MEQVHSKYQSVSTRLHSVTSEKTGVFTTRISFLDTNAGVYLQFENLEIYIVVHRVSDVKQIEIHIAESLVPDLSPFEVEIAIAKLQKYKLPVIDQIPAELTQAGGETLQSEIRKLINSIWNKEELPDKWKEPIIVPVHKKGDKIDCSKCHGISLLQLHTKFYQISFSQS
jgi:hypothetical protein